uniref:U-box domain-containing protein n=1 Tax=Oryza meridionalis TaxID=40149 RepID=A0A0E0CLP2_9ORYZ
MVRKEMGGGRLAAEYQGLEVKVPTFFRCPISLDVMRSPVSLCTGVTYDRASIQRWIDSGNTTCPATMLPLPSTDLVPNLTLRRLIALWASTAAPSPAVGPTPAAAAAGLLHRVAAPGVDPCPALRKLAAFLSDDDVDEFDKNALARAGGAAETVASVLRRRGKGGGDDDDDAGGVEAVEAAVRVLAVLATSDCIEEENRRRVAAALAAGGAAPSVAASLARVMRSGSGLEARVDAARLVESLLRDGGGAATPGVRAAVAESEELVAELIRLVGPADEKGGLDPRAVDAGLSCLAAIVAGTRRARVEMVRLGAVPAAVRVLATDHHGGSHAQALRVLEAAVGCAEGRAAVCEVAEAAIPAVVSRMMRCGGMGGAEAAVSVLWAVCHRYRDRRAVEAAAASKGGLTKLLLLMQSGCSPAARQMASELLKMFKVNSKSCLAGYDSKTTHIMPF